MPTPEELEDAAAADAVRGLKRKLEEITRKGVALYESMDPDNVGSRAMVRNLLANQLSSVADPDSNELATIPLIIEESAREAFGLAKIEAARDLGVADAFLPMSGQSRKLGNAAQAAASEELKQAAARMAKAESAEDVLEALTEARRAITRTEAAARYTVNQALSEGTTAVTEQAGASRLWIPERDACVHCLAYAGEVAGPGEDFRGGLTFGAKPLIPASATLAGAPLHPNCRCRVVPWRPEWAEPGEVSRPDALKREALRSILRGFSLPSESERVRVQAAERALKQAGSMPKSVQDYARRAIKKGSFPRGRDFPRPQKVSAVRTLRNPNPQLQVETSPPKDPFAALPTREVRDPAAERADALRNTNPKYGEPGYGINCVHVVAAVELRRRGFDVRATALPQEMWGERGRDLNEALGRWSLPDGLTRTMRPVISYGGLQTRTLEEIRAEGPGTRGWVSLAWKDRGAHVFSWEVDAAGRVRLYDAQNGKELTRPGDYFSRAKASRIVRIDDLIPGPGVLELVESARTTLRQMTPAERLAQTEGNF